MVVILGCGCWVLGLLVLFCWWVFGIGYMFMFSVGCLGLFGFDGWLRLCLFCLVLGCCLRMCFVGGVWVWFWVCGCLVA